MLIVYMFHSKFTIYADYKYTVSHKKNWTLFH